MPTAPTTSPVKLTKATLRAIPGYDPFASAGNCTFDKELAQRALDFFAECLTFTAGEKAGEPFKLERWQVAIVGNLFGWVRPDGTRRYREAYIEVPKKLSKKQRELLQELAEIEDADVTPQRKTFLEKLKERFGLDG